MSGGLTVWDWIVGFALIILFTGTRGAVRNAILIICGILFVWRFLAIAASLP